MSGGRLPRWGRPVEQSAAPQAARKPGLVAIASVGPLAPPVLAYWLGSMLGGPPDYPSWPLLLPVIGVLAVPTLAGMMTRALGSWSAGVWPLAVAGLAGAAFGFWFAATNPGTGGPLAAACATPALKEGVTALAFASAMIIPGAITALMVRPRGSRRRLVLAALGVWPLTVLIGYVLFVGLSVVLSSFGPPGCQGFYLG